MKPMALGAHLYNLTSTPWTQFHKGHDESKPSKATLYSYEFNIDPTPLAAPAILSFMALHNKNRSILIPPSDAPAPSQASVEWDAEWNRSVEGSTGRTFRPGSAEGVWQGFFTFTDFTGYGLILGGAPPGVIQGSAMGRHQHTWKLREHYLVGPATRDDDSGVDLTLDNDDSDRTPSSSSKPQPLPAGDPLRSFFPTGTQLVERDEGVTVRDSRTGKVYEYVRRPPGVAAGRDLPGVKDVIITGEGHSAWGQFNLVGRVRPRDGLITVSKDYVDGDRGKWLYRGYLIGDVAGNISGRWRDTISPADATGYEGCFYMSRRR